jgi:hypothetical protein
MPSGAVCQAQNEVKQPQEPSSVFIIQLFTLQAAFFEVTRYRFQKNSKEMSRQPLRVH